MHKENLEILNLIEQDRQRIARDIHDSSLQNLANLGHKTELASLYIDSDPMKAKLELATVRKIINEIIDDIRGTIFDLRSMTFDDLGFEIALNRLLDVVNENKNLKIVSDIKCIDNVETRVNSIALSTIYRIIQECFNNIIQHSEATEIDFTCHIDNDSCIIHIVDNGKGFDFDKILKKEFDNNYKHFGLRGLKERVNLLCGEINVNSIIDKGTTIDIKIPI